MAEYTGNRIGDLDENTPDGAIEPPSNFDNAIREIKRALKNLVLDDAQDIPSKSGNAGKLLQVKSDESGFEYVPGIPALSGNSGKVLTVNTSEDQLEWDDVFPSGTQMIFYQADPPPGWEIVNVTNGVLLYVDNDNGGTAKSGGTWTIGGLTADSHHHSISTDGRHNHLIPYGDYIGPGSTYGKYTADDGSHNHGGVTGNTTVNVSSDGSWRPPGYNCIIARRL